MERYPILVEEQTNHGPATFPCAVYQVKAAQSKREKIYCHWHKEVELLLILSGSASLHIGQKIYPVSSGTFALIPSNAVHMAFGSTDEEFRFIAVLFHPDFLRSFGSDSIQEKYLSPLFRWQFDCSPVLPDTQDFPDLILDIASCYQKKADGYELYIKARLLQLCFLLYQYAKDFQFQKQDSRDYQISLIKDMMIYLQEQCSETVTLQEMADHFHISKGHLCRFFKEMTNTSPIDYLNYYRINKSSQLLRDTDLSISAVAGQTGFNNISYYNRTFRKYMHMTPGEYRKKLTL